VSQPIDFKKFQLPAEPLPTTTRQSAVSRMERRVRRTAAIGGAVVVTLFLAAALTPIGGAVIASGQVDVASRVKRIAHPRGGVVAQILVRDGQHVEKGQVLARLDDAVPGAEYRLTGLTVDQLVAQRARIEAEASGASSIVWPASLTARNDSAAVDAMKAERTLFETRRAEAFRMREQLSARISQYQAQLANYDAQIISARRQSVLIQPERAGIGSLYEKGLIPISRRNQIERSAMELDGSIGSFQASIVETRAKIAETKAQLEQQTDTRRAEAGGQLASLSSAINQQQITAANAKDQRDNMLIRAPYPGTVSHLQIASAGEVVQPNETFAEIVPDRDLLVVEAMVSPTDIDQVGLATSTRVRFSSFNRAATPEIAGKVIFVGANRTTSPDGKTSYYSVRIALDRAALAANPTIQLKPGMPAEVYVTTGTRSILTYILKPLLDQFSRAMKD